MKHNSSLEFQGTLDKNVMFSFGDETTAFATCGVTFKNEHYVFGGYRNTNRQVYKR